MNNQSKKMKEQLEALPNELTPSRDLWPGIELALTGAQEERKPNRWPVAVAAGLIVPAVLVWLFMSQSQVPVNTPNPTVVAQMSKQFESQKASLLVAYQDQNALADNWQGQLTELESAAEAIKAALKNDPNNMALLRMLQSVYQQQIDLIERVHAPKWQQI
ncbi:hypothetical protein [Alteromonas lipolytica]|uniref:Uncharacterized protein n=1 Tax=Alteromonas lipolytica TaxID=1856405 RepID=A0A1E8F8A4_9ALTE|nr:hypothetical protein [Alteromonas lipolytica]OFI32145.1 hypothetical protein BFC17_07915 [Alteromonas lipolytica]GGF83521.1 hypothetical protein GCM10011338_39840 [Alteromonas lipolytica]